MNPAETVRVDLGARSYDVVIGAGLLAQAGARIAPLLARPRVAILCDETVARLHLPALTRALDAAGIAHKALALPAGPQGVFSPFLQRAGRASSARSNGFWPSGWSGATS